MDKFEIGEVAEFISSIPGHNRDVTIVGPLQARNFKQPCPLTGRSGGVTYLMCDPADAPEQQRQGRAVWPFQLRKKHQPRDDLQVVRWSECPWQPQTVNS